MNKLKVLLLSGIAVLILCLPVYGQYRSGWRQANVDSLKFKEQASAPSTPVSRIDLIYVDPSKVLRYLTNTGTDTAILTTGTSTASPTFPGLTLTGQLIVPLGSAANPSIEFIEGSGDGVYTVASGNMRFGIGGSVVGGYNSAVLFMGGNSAGNPTLETEVASATNPVHTFVSFETYGLGGSPASEYISLIADSNETVRVGTDTVTIGIGTKHDGYIISDAAEVQTGTDTQTTLDSITLLDENTYHVDAFVVAVQSDGTDRASYHIACTAYRTGAGNAALQGSVTSLHSQESNGSADCTFTVSGNDLRLSWTGIAGETWEAGSTLKYINISN